MELGRGSGVEGSIMNTVRRKSVSRRRTPSALAGGSSGAFGFIYWFQAQTSACRSLCSELRMDSSFLLGYRGQDTSTQHVHNYIQETSSNKESHENNPHERVRDSVNIL